jgi:DHA2 family multidrug resistance protein
MSGANPVSRSASITPPAPPVEWRAWVGILAVLLGSLVSTLSGRLTTFGLSDIRGAVHAGFDEGAWISTAFTTAQMVMALPAIWLAAALGPRRVLMAGAVGFVLASALLPFSSSITHVLIWQAVAGLCSGVFIPLTIGFVARSLPPHLVVFGLAAYAMNIELSLNIAASIEGWLTEHLSWHWIFWSDALLALPLLLCVHFGMPRQKPDITALRRADWGGILLGSVGFAMLYAALDQGNRLDWTSSGLIVGLLLGGGLLISAFLINEALVPQPALHLRVLLKAPLPLVATLIVLFRFVILSTAYLIPQFLTVIQNYRGLETGGVLLWIALPQFLLAPLTALLLRRVDARLLVLLGLGLIGIACVMASGLTRDWVTGDFLPSQIIQAVGQSISLIAILLIGVRSITPAEALNLGATIQIARLLGGELGLGFIQTFVRRAEQLHSNLLGLHVVAGGPLTTERLQTSAAALLPQSHSLAEAQAKAAGLLARSIAAQANILAYGDSFMVMAWVCLGGIGLVAFFGRR